jgi:hypothetical protein
MDRRLGGYAAWSIVVLAIAYVLTGAVWFIQSPDRLSLAPSEPYLTLLEILLFVSLPPQVVLFGAIHGYAGESKKTCALIALAFATLLTGISGAVHFVTLTVGRQTGYAGIPGEHAFYPWPTVLLAMDLFAWDILQGLALLFAAPVFHGGRLQRAIRATMFISGALCVIGVIGPASGDLRFQLLAIAGYAFVFPFVCLLLALFFRRATVTTS